jgi:RNA polymerase sigma factor (sigma-70 family)
MKNNNPFAIASQSQSNTLALIQKIQKGNKESLNELLRAHQDYIFNIAMKMLNSIQDAEDVTQEVLIKIVSNLAKYDSSKSKFTTWAYRITFNHILNFRKSAAEKYELTFPKFFEFIESVPDEEVEEETFMGVSIEEARISCTAGMLMCLNREQRLVYIVGEVFKIDHNLAAEIFDITPSNFRKKLSRVRKDLYQWMHKKCGLVNLDNPCRCKKKTKEFIKQGIVNPENYKWQSNFKSKIREFVAETMDKNLKTTDALYAKIHQDVPFKNSLTADEVFASIIQNEHISKLIDPFTEQ